MEFIQVIIFVAVIAFVIYNNLQKEKAKERKRNPAQPVNAPMPHAPESPFLDGEEQEPPMTRLRRQQHEPNAATAQQHQPRRNPPRATVPAAKKTAQPAREEISLRSAAEARKAFIYSEIFNRKY